MMILQPKDIATDTDGIFPCSQKPGFEAREFRMPSSDCADCVIELEFAYNDQKLYYCSDIILLA